MFIFRKLRKTDSPIEAFDIVIETDPYIYKDIFQNSKKKYQIFETLFLNPESYFYFDNYYGLFLDNVLIGLVSIQSPENVFDEDSLRIAYMEQNLKIPDAAIAANKYLHESVCKIGDLAYACNICVRKEYRGLGYGDLILKDIIKIIGNNIICLTVIANNVAALNLYKKNGFRIKESFLDYGGFGNAKILCYSMIRIPK